MAAITQDQHARFVAQLKMMAVSLPFAGAKLREAALHAQRVADLADQLGTMAEELARIIGEPSQTVAARPELRAVPARGKDGE